MVASHDSFTYLNPDDLWMKLLTPFWRCQSLTICEQYNLGVRYFDIRVRRSKKAGLFNKIFNRYDDKFKWSICHGIIQLDFIKFDNIEYICKYFKDYFPDAYYRIYLESGNSEIKEEFKRQIIKLEKKYPKLCWYGYKIPWVTLYMNIPVKEIKDLTCKLFNWSHERSFIKNIKNFKFNTIKEYSKNNPKITEEMINDNNILYFMDYIK